MQRLPFHRNKLHEERNFSAIFTTWTRLSGTCTFCVPKRRQCRSILKNERNFNALQMSDGPLDVRWAGIIFRALLALAPSECQSGEP